MRFHFFYIILIFFISEIKAQVGVNTTIVNSAAVLHLEAQNTSSIRSGGFLMPIVTEVQQVLIPVSIVDNRDDGLMVFVSDPVTGKRCWEVYDGVLYVWRSINCTNNNCNSDILYEEDFDSYLDETGVNGLSSTNGNYPGGVTKWSLTSFVTFGDNTPNLPGTLIDEDDYAKVISGVLSFRDTNGTFLFETQSIDISGYSDINISMDFSESGSLEYIDDHTNDFECGESESDYIDIEYSLDNGVTFIEIANYAGFGNANHTLVDDLTGTVSFSLNGISGATIILRVRLQNWAADEYYYLDNVLVTCN
ncbi:MAG: hypothetical protein ACJAX7_002131 [Saprospiraceae bacterium]|jgi:hypothetical protein